MARLYTHTLPDRHQRGLRKRDSEGRGTAANGGATGRPAAQTTRIASGGSQKEAQKASSDSVHERERLIPCTAKRFRMSKLIVATAPYPIPNARRHGGTWGRSAVKQHWQTGSGFLNHFLVLSVQAAVDFLFRVTTFSSYNVGYAAAAAAYEYVWPPFGPHHCFSLLWLLFKVWPPPRACAGVGGRFAERFSWQSRAGSETPPRPGTPPGGAGRSQW